MTGRTDMPASDVLALEERALNAWPALHTVAIGGWLCRLSGGCTKRANSVNALAPQLDVASVRPAVEALYATQGLPAIFRLSPLAPAESDRTLEAAGYARLDPSLVMLAPTPDDQAAPASVDIDAQPSSDWLAGIAAANGIAPALRPIHDAMVRSIVLPAAFATVRQDGAPVGFGLAVRERGMVGLFDLVVAPTARRRGHGRAMVQALMAWGRTGRASAAYLQVRGVNEAALTLYRQLGFQEAYRYHYRQAPIRP